MIYLGVFFSFCLLYYSYFVLRASWYFGRKKKKETSPESSSVSIIIPARNEAGGIATCLDSVLAQSYSGAWEVIVVNDHSTDETAAIVDSFVEKNAQLRLLELTETSGKKAALTAAIEAARYNIILQTDADCIVSPTWLQAMSETFSEQTEMVSGPVLLTHDKSLFQQLQSLEYLGLVTLGAGSLLSGHPNMANGANIAYRKAAFLDVGGFSGIDHVASGDDELLLQKILERGADRITFCKDQRAIVRTPAQANWASFKVQRLRWVSKARTYRNRWVNVTQMISWLAFVGLAFVSFAAMVHISFVPWALTFWLAKIVADAWMMLLASHFFQQNKLLLLFLLLQFLYVPYVIWIGIAGNLITRYDWKERVVS